MCNNLYILLMRYEFYPYKLLFLSNFKDHSLIELNTTCITLTLHVQPKRQKSGNLLWGPDIEFAVGPLLILYPYMKDPWATLTLNL